MIDCYNNNCFYEILFSTVQEHSISITIYIHNGTGLV